MSRIEIYEDLMKQMHDTYVAKNADYGDSVVKTYDDFGMVSFATRIADKFNRFTNLVKKGEQEKKVKDESLEDTLIDMANYCMLAVVERRIRKNLWKNTTAIKLDTNTMPSTITSTSTVTSILAEESSYMHNNVY